MMLLLDTRGLRTRGDRRHASQPLGLSGVHSMLSCPYYAGTVTYRGKQYEGRHEPLITRELFDQVQAVLASHRHSGERDRKHQHCLKGTIRCGTCGCRLVYSRHNGNGGIYEYFICKRNQHGLCPQGYQPVDLVERAVENHYRGVTISQAERETVRQAITEDLGKRIATARQEIDRCHGVLQEVKEQERKLLNMHYEDRISSELFDDEQTRLRKRRQDAEALIARLNVNHDDVTATLNLALEILGEDLHDLYQRADDTVRRLLNQAIFKTLYIGDEVVTDAELTGPFAALRDLRDAIHRLPGSTTPYPAPAVVASTLPQDAKAPAPKGERGLLDFGSTNDVLVPPPGVEPGSTA
jgi:site-specific DNA recombinase